MCPELLNPEIFSEERASVIVTMLGCLRAYIGISQQHWSQEAVLYMTPQIWAGAGGDVYRPLDLDRVGRTGKVSAGSGMASGNVETLEPGNVKPR